MDTLIFKNTSSSNPVEVNDLGIYLDPLQELDLITNFQDEQIVESLDIESSLLGDAEVWLNNVTQLTYTQLVQYLTKLSQYDTIDFSYISGKDSNTDVTSNEIEALTDGSDITLHTHDNRYYTETELSTSGSAIVHWNNITNAPSFGDLHWKASVDRTDSSYGSGTILPVVGNELSDARMVTDDGDGKPAQYVCITTTGLWDTQWIKIADVDWGNAINIGITPTGNLTSTNIQDGLEELQGDINTINSTLNTFDLDSAYNNGSTIIIDNGPVILDATSSSHAPLQLTQQSAFPTSGLVAGQLTTINGEVYSYDGIRSKWLSIGTTTYSWADKNADGKILPIGESSHGGTGYMIPQNATIIKVTVWSSGGEATKAFEIRRNGVATSLKSFSLSGGTYISTNDNVNLNAGDVLQVYVSSAGNKIESPVVTVYLKWRQ